LSDSLTTVPMRTNSQEKPYLYSRLRNALICPVWSVLRKPLQRAKHIEDDRLRELKTQYEVAHGTVLDHEVVLASRLSDCIITHLGIEAEVA